MGHRVWYDGLRDTWLYEDTGEPVEGNIRRCNYCNEERTKEGHDPCIANLPDVVFACCGHGEVDSCYVAFSNGEKLRDQEAYNYLRGIRRVWER